MKGTVSYDRRSSLVIAPVSGAPGRELTGLRVVFEVKKTSQSHANTASVKVYNLRQDTRNAILVKKAALILKAGYSWSGAELPVVASGVVLRVEHSAASPDVETSVDLRDGGLGLDDSKVRRAYPAGSIVGDVVKAIVATMPDVTLGTLDAEAMTRKFTSKRVLSGSSRVALDGIATAYGFEWSVQDGVLQALDRTNAKGQQYSAAVISAKTGMIGSPTKTDAGCKVDSLLLPFVLPGSFIKVESSFCSGYFKALTVEHKGDTHGDEWKTTIDAKSLDKWQGPGKKSKGKK